MAKVMRVVLQLSAGAFYILGAVFIPFGVWAIRGQGSSPFLGWFIYFSSIAMPWGIAFVLARISVRRN